MWWHQLRLLSSNKFVILCCRFIMYPTYCHKISKAGSVKLLSIHCVAIRLSTGRSAKWYQVQRSDEWYCNSNIFLQCRSHPTEFVEHKAKFWEGNSHSIHWWHELSGHRVHLGMWWRPPRPHMYRWSNAWTQSSIRWIRRTDSIIWLTAIAST